MSTKACTLVTEFAPAPAMVAQAHFEALVSLETDCWDVHESMRDASVRKSKVGDLEELVELMSAHAAYEHASFVQPGKRE